MLNYTKIGSVSFGVDLGERNMLSKLIKIKTAKKHVKKNYLDKNESL